MTLFDETVGDMMSESILGRAQERDLIRIEAHQIRDYTLNKQKQVDDYPYGGGRGAVMQADPLYQCWKYIVDTYGPGRTIYMSPAGKTFDQAAAKRLKNDYDHLILVCGHYEGIDERFIEECVDEELSMGDFVLTGGEIPAMAVADAVARMVPGVLPDPECFEEESHYNGMLEYPQYSRPEVWHDRAVPSILLSGHHANIAKWRRKQALLRTRTRRPDLYARLDLSSKSDQKLLRELEAEEAEIPPYLTRFSLFQPKICIFSLQVTQTFVGQPSPVSDSFHKIFWNYLAVLELSLSKHRENLSIGTNLFSSSPVLDTNGPPLFPFHRPNRPIHWGTSILSVTFCYLSFLFFPHADGIRLHIISLFTLKSSENRVVSLTFAPNVAIIPVL